MDHHHFSHEHPLEFIKDPNDETKILKKKNLYAMNVKAFAELELDLAPQINHLSHPQHPLVVRLVPSGKHVCDLCHKSLKEFVYYHCASCSFYLDIDCASLGSEINHPFHPTHPLIFLPKSPYPQGYYICNFCHGPLWESLYHCASCNFNLDITCASRHLLIPHDKFTELNFFSHEHPLIFIKQHDEDVPAFCFGCDKRLSGPVYRCLECNNFDLHKKCAELPKKVLHVLHRQHPVTLLKDPPFHQETCTCDICEKDYQGFVYHCSSCNFTRPIEDFFKSSTIAVPNHEHELIFLQRQIPFICDFCGFSGDRNPYICGTCQILLHESCISLPSVILTYTHQHLLFLGNKGNPYEKWECKICREEIDSQYGSYTCLPCRYIVHVKCSIGVIQNEGDELMKSENLIPEVFKEKGTLDLEEIAKAPEIKHVYHEHSLIPTNSGDVKGDNICDGCLMPVSVPFYSCERCGFFLHKHCAELSRHNRLPIHKHLLTLTKNGFTRYDTCGHYHHGFSYKCDRIRCNFKIDLQCGFMPITLRHPSHSHSLFLDRNYAANCSGCHGHIPRVSGSGAFRCQPCGYVLDFKCARLPLTAWYKYDKHDLTLAYHDSSDPSQLYCDIYEEERQPNSWFYCCEHCDNSVHIDCIIGDLRFVKLGSRFRRKHHPHTLTFVKKIWNCPPCNVCHKICYTQALECEEPECDFIVHWKCLHEQVK